ncbi:NF-kappa-B inhibitor cactus [Anopheles aquasalis]|uniref:NF-kappa-B inhibitor cactus n=1 Tax=Anopheles aquasalis TaxID=42839 RepID=UPI00215B3DD1|nr:NF-kappa-B inhibitor cactus [Anopheles aquasalis]
MHSSRGPAMNKASITAASSEQQQHQQQQQALAAGKKDFCESANTDSGFLSEPNLNSSEHVCSSESISEGPAVAVTSPTVANQKELAIEDSAPDSGMVADIEPDCDIMDICERFERLRNPDEKPQLAWNHQNDMGDTNLHLAIYAENADLVRKLVANLPSPFLNIQNDAAHTALHLAVLMDQPKTVRRLVLAGAGLTVRDAYGNTALHLACGQSNLHCVKELLTPLRASEMQQHHVVGVKVPQNLELWNYDGKTCIHLAAETGSLPILKCLIDAGANINAREGKSGHSALHISIEQGNEELANFLLDECPRVALDMETYAGLTAYQLALLQNKMLIAKQLTTRGADPTSPPESDIESDSDDELISNYYGANAFSATFPGLSAINVS